jgi:hypothetical protein
LTSPSKTESEQEAAVLAVRRENLAWGVRKIAGRLRRQGLLAPSPSTITAILRRNGLPMVAAGQKAWKRFEHATPNALWQMDFKGPVTLGRARRHPLTVATTIRATPSCCKPATTSLQTVQSAVQAAFERAAPSSFQGRRLKASKALVGKAVALRRTQADGVFELVFLRKPVHHVPGPNIKAGATGPCRCARWLIRRPPRKSPDVRGVR